MTLTLHRSSRETDVGALRPGRDLVLEVAPEHGLVVPTGVAIEDHVDPVARVEVDEAARRSLAAWRERRGGDLFLEGVDLGFVAEVELMARCFLPAEILRRGLAAAGSSGAIEAVGFEPEALGALATIAPSGATIDGRPAPPPPAPARGGRRTALRELGERTRIPPLAHGAVVCVPYWHLTGTYRRLLRRKGGPRPVPVGMGISGLDRAESLALLLHGGWGGSTGSRSREASTRRTEERLTELAREPLGETDRERALDLWALRVVAWDAADAPAQYARFDRLTRSAGAVVVTPFDSPGEQRTLVAAARANGVPSLVVQHGFRALLNDPDLTVSDQVAVWSDHDRRLIEPEARGPVTVTGNPGASTPDVASGGRTTGPAVVLVEYPGRLSARVGGRVNLEHVACALDGLALGRPGAEVIVRPHPSDDRHATYLSALAGHTEGLRVRVDRTTPIEPLLATASLCVGALSTATLQAGAMGVPTVFLDVTGTPRPWPFDGTLAHADGVESLAAAVSHPPADVRAVAGEALGVRPGAEDAVVELIDSIAARTRR